MSVPPTTFSSEEIEHAFRAMWQVGPVGEDWFAQAKLYTDDCVYFDHFYGTMTAEQFGPWCDALMNEQFPELYTAYQWHVVDGDSVVVLVQNRRDNPDPAGPPYFDFPSITVYRYGGGGRWAGERDYWNMDEAVAAGRRYRAACAEHDPDHPARRSRLHWPDHPDWAHPSSAARDRSAR
jgi:ketosteroid isomerase-like protein